MQATGRTMGSAARRTGRFLLGVLIAIAGAGIAQGDDYHAGTVTLMEGVTDTEYVKVIRPGFTGILQIKPGDALFAGDTVKTGEGVKAKIELSDGTVISLAPRSTLQVTAYSLDKAAARRSSVLKVLKGTMRFIVGSRVKAAPGAADAAWKDSQVMIATSNCVAQVRGTDLFITAENGDSEIVVLDGAVAVRSTQASVRGEVLVGPNQMTSVIKSGQPAPVEIAAAQRLDQLARSTAIKKGILVLSPDQLKDLPANRFKESDVARDVVAGLPISVVLERAIDSGMTTDDAVGAAINAGVNPTSVVYTAIQEGYAPSKVVQSSIGHGVPSTQVFSAALAAGADRQSVISGAQAAGMPAPAIAGAMASSTAGDILVISSLPAAGSAPLSSLLPATAVPISGGGGAPSSIQPQTQTQPQPASPFR